jgi:hypothetical protein
MKRKKSKKAKQKVKTRNMIEHDIKNFEDKLKKEKDPNKQRVYKEILKILRRDDKEFYDNYYRRSK